jgi:hypothetical protein
MENYKGYSDTFSVHSIAQLPDLEVKVESI